MEVVDGLGHLSVGTRNQNWSTSDKPACILSQAGVVASAAARQTKERKHV